MLYQSERAQPAGTTRLRFEVDAVRDVVEQLKARAVVFEEYDLPGVKTVNRVAEHPSGARRACFKDPDGNILQILRPGTSPPRQPQRVHSPDLASWLSPAQSVNPVHAAQHPEISVSRARSCRRAVVESLRFGEALHPHLQDAKPLDEPDLPLVTRAMIGESAANTAR